MEFSNLGKHCFFCKQLDFLPFECDLCKNFFCKLHRTENKHECIKIKKDKDNNVKIIKNKDKIIKCAYKKCKKKGCLVDYKCKECKNTFCAYHRLHNDHKNNIKKTCLDKKFLNLPLNQKNFYLDMAYGDKEIAYKMFKEFDFNPGREILVK